MDANEEELQEFVVRVSTRSNITSKRLERLYGLKNERSGYLSTVTARRKDIEALLADGENVELVKEKLSLFLAAFETFKDAHVTYSSHLQDEISFARCQEQFNLESLRVDDFCKRVQDWIESAEEIVRFNSQIKPDDSASQIPSRSASKSSTRRSQRSNRSSSRTSASSSVSIARAKEAARIAELKAEAATFKKRQSSEEQKFRLQQEQERLSLETEIAKSEAKGKVLASIMEATPRYSVPKPTGLVSTKSEEKYQVSTGDRFRDNESREK